MFGSESSAASSSAQKAAPASNIADKYAGARGFGSAKNVIMIFLQGGPSHIDIWDPKPDAPANIRGEFKPIKTKIPGTHIGEHMPMMAQHLDKATLIRSMSYTPNGLFNHTAAIYQMLTGYPPDKVSPSGQLEPPTPPTFPTAGSHVVEAEAAEGSGAAVRRAAAAAAGIGHHRQGRRRRIPRQGLRSVPHVSGSGAEGHSSTTCRCARRSRRSA